MALSVKGTCKAYIAHAFGIVRLVVGGAHANGRPRSAGHGDVGGQTAIDGLFSVVYSSGKPAQLGYITDVIITTLVGLHVVSLAHAALRAEAIHVGVCVQSALALVHLELREVEVAKVVLHAAAHDKTNVAVCGGHVHVVHVRLKVILNMLAREGCELCPVRAVG